MSSQVDSFLYTFFTNTALPRRRVGKVTGPNAKDYRRATERSVPENESNSGSHRKHRLNVERLVTDTSRENHDWAYADQIKDGDERSTDVQPLGAANT